MRILALIVLLAGCLAVAPVAAQEESTASPEPTRIEQLRAALDEGDPGSLEPQAVSPDLLGEEGAAAQREAFAAYYRYRTNGYEHRQRVFRWQLLSSRIIFVMVILLVCIGLYFSWLQFRSALKSGGTDSAGETTFEASTSGLKVSSPVLGVIILAISLAFFYLYLVYVYPITEIL
jgi:hypothetical protein